MGRAQTLQIDSAAVWQQLLAHTELAHTLQALGEEVKGRVVKQMPLLSKLAVRELDDTLSIMTQRYLVQHVLPVLKKHLTLDDAIEINAFYGTVAGSKLKEMQLGLAAEMTAELQPFCKELNSKITDLLHRAAETNPDNDNE